MISFSLSKNNFIPLQTKYTIIKVDCINFENNKHHVLDSINNFNSEIEWDEMFTLKEAESRVSNNMRMYIGLMDSKVFGHVWFREYKDGVYLFNLFVKNNTTNKTYTGTEFTSDVINRFETQYPIYVNIDDWNVKSIRLFKKLGFRPI
jgi:RimJ/RimL family protein N-acetyltransferase